MASSFLHLAQLIQWLYPGRPDLHFTTGSAEQNGAYAYLQVTDSVMFIWKARRTSLTFMVAGELIFFWHDAVVCQCIRQRCCCRSVYVSTNSRQPVRGWKNMVGLASELLTNAVVASIADSVTRWINRLSTITAQAGLRNETQTWHLEHASRNDLNCQPKVTKQWSETISAITLKHKSKEICYLLFRDNESMSWTFSNGTCSCKVRFWLIKISAMMGTRSS